MFIPFASLLWVNFHTFFRHDLKLNFGAFPNFQVPLEISQHNVLLEQFAIDEVDRGNLVDFHLVFVSCAIMCSRYSHVTYKTAGFMHNLRLFNPLACLNF